MATILAENVTHDDRRHVVNAGVLHGRDAQITNLRAIAEVGVADFSSTVIAVRGARLALVHISSKDRDQRPENVLTEELGVVEINSDNRMAAYVAFDLDDFDAAMAELDARYLAGEAALHAHTWSIVASGCAALNRRESLPTTPDWVNNDHRRGIAFNPGDLTAYISTAWNLLSNGGIYIETAHRLNDLGAVFTWRGYGTPQEGSDVEFRGINMLSVEGDLISRVELFDEADLDAALAKFDQLSRPTPPLENAASQAYERFRTYFAARDWAAMAELLAADTSVDDHRRVVNAEIRRGRDVEIANMQAFAGIGATRSTATVIATRGERLVLCRTCISGEEQQPGAFNIEFLNLVEITADKRIAARSAFDLDDIDAAFEELDARYLAGEAAPYASVWKRALDTLGEVNRHEPGPMIERLAFTDHRRVSFADGDFRRAIEELWPLVPDARYRATAVHALDAHGVVASLVIEGTDAQGNELQWARTLLLDPNEPRLEIYEESDLDGALARLEGLRPEARRLENAASRVIEQFLARFADRDWDAMAELLAEDMSSDDRRRVVNAGIRRGRDAEIANWQATAEIWRAARSTVVAIRGERLALFRVGFASQDRPLEAFQAAALAIVEINEDNRGAANVVFDIDDIDAAFEELDARYLAGEAAAYSQTWSVIAQIHAAFNRHELPAIDWLTVDHRRGTLLSSSNMTAAIRAFWDLTPAVNMQIEVVHRLNRFGAVATHTLRGTSPEGFEAEWRMIYVVIVEDEGIDRVEMFDEADLEAALARFEELQPPGSRLENAASAKHARLTACVATRDWNGLSEILADDIAIDDRRRVVNSGITYGRDAAVANMAGVIGVGLTNISSDVVAIRGDRLDLCRTCVSGQDRPGAFQVEFLSIVEIDADERIVARVLFDPDDIDAAFKDLDARYLAGEAAAHAQTWWAIMQACAALNRREIFATTTDFIDIDHRSLAAIESGDLKTYMREALNDGAYNVYVEAVHRLSELGAVVTLVSNGISQVGFDGEWRMADIFTVEGGLINRCEIFDEADLDAALARFDELHPQPSRLENAASQVSERFWTHFAARDWEAMAELTADNICSDDRRRVVNGGVRHGREAHIADMRVIAEIVDPRNLTPTVIATRGDHLALSHIRSSNRVVGPDEISAEVLSIVEINGDDRIVANVGFDIDDIDAAFEELDARYLAGEAAAHAPVWSVIAAAYAALNRHELPATKSDWVTIDHRVRESFQGGDLTAYIRSAWEVAPDLKIYIETVHRLSNHGAVVTHAAYGTSPGGFDAEWRIIGLLAVGRNWVNRCELFDEADLDAALAHFEELQRPARRLENAASRADDRFFAYFWARNWAALGEILADETFIDDRRPVVNAGLWHGRDVVIANLRAVADAAAIITSVIATRGERLALSRMSSSNRDPRQGEFRVEMLNIVEIDTEGRIVAHVDYDVNDIDAAFAELDARYLAGEAAAHARTWSVIAGGHAGFNRQQSAATTPDVVYVDRRPIVSLEGVELGAAQRAVWDLTPDATGYVEAVHRLSEFGTVITQAVTGTSQEGFAAEWRMIAVCMVEGDLLCRYEVFDEADLDAALARFDELHPETRRLENAASQAAEGLWGCFAARDWAEMAETMADDIVTHDHRRVVNADVLHGRDAHVTNMQAVAEVGFEGITSTVVATRGQRLALIRIQSSIHGFEPGEMSTEMLSVVEVDGDNRLTASGIFDGDDIDAALARLEARYLEGEAAPYVQVWSAITEGFAVLSRGEIPAITPEFEDIDRRSGPTMAPGDLIEFLRAAFADSVGIKMYVEAVHRLTGLGAVVTHVAKGMSQAGFDAEWRMIDVFTVEGELVSRSEFFDEADLEAALARFDELDRSAPTA
ncbi:nuclear transport factor 2 family protein [Mycobacterium sp. SP-6446]|uniref:nuclear transport factor 2 family protein n=1 Tax=Mycobacterium sp. SP-6446 TaxID=1834162 RepID=UPI001C3791F9|nr:nuclear transport factor 2 family protein [Mycobacterium sp. SP-6446]